MKGRIDNDPGFFPVNGILFHGCFSRDAGKRHNRPTGRYLGTSSFHLAHNWNQGPEPAVYQDVKGYPGSRVLR